MRKEYGEAEALRERLQRLRRLEVVPAFAREFYGLLVRYSLRGVERGVAELALRLLDIELRHYRRLEREQEQGGTPDTEALQEKRNIALEVLYERTRLRGSAPNPRTERVRRLVLAECAFGMERSEAVVAHLEQALAAGADDPLVYFALGYARFMLALQSLVHLDSDDCVLSAVNGEDFRRLCLAAVCAFEGALTGGPRDRAVLWWIGRALLSAGHGGSGRELLARVALEEDTEHEELAERRGDYDPAQPPLPAPITDEEQDRFAQTINRPHSLALWL